MSTVPSVNKGKYAWQRAFSALFALFALTGVSPPAPQKTKITRKFIADRCKAVLPELQMRTDKERPEENTCRIVKGHRGMGVFLPVKTVSVLVNRWYDQKT